MRWKLNGPMISLLRIKKLQDFTEKKTDSWCQILFLIGIGLNVLQENFGHLPKAGFIPYPNGN
jgi:hypothetical protein